MFDSYERTQSYFENSPMKALGLPTREELALLEPFRDILPERAFGNAITPPVSDGSGRDRRNLRRAYELLIEAGCRFEGVTCISRRVSLSPLSFSTSPARSNPTRCTLPATCAGLASPAICASSMRRNISAGWTSSTST